MMNRTVMGVCVLKLNFLLMLVILSNDILIEATFSNVYTVSSPSNPCSEGIHNCHQLTFYVRDSLKYFVSNVQFIFLSGKHTLNNTLHPILISNMRNSTFEGSSIDLPIIHCIEGTYGFYFENSTNVTISSLVFEGCGPTIHSSALTVIQGSAWRFVNITISNTAGIGLILRNINTFEISDSKFFNNGLGIWNCSSLVNDQWGSSVSVISTSIDKVINYTIRDTVFRGNTHNQLGGGLHMNIIKPSSVFVEVRHSVFDGINGCLFTGANITIDEYSVRCNVSVMESIFVNNNRYDMPNYFKELDGGGLKINATENQSSAAVHYTSCQIFVGNSMFMNNQSPYCAAAGVFTSSIINLKVNFSNITVIGNIGFRRTGGVCVIPVGSSQITKKHYQLKISDSIFQNNIGHDGAALLIWPQTLASGLMTYDVTIENCTFRSNNVNCTQEFKLEKCISWHSIAIHLGNHNLRQLRNKNEVFVTLKKTQIIENLSGPALHIASFDSVVVYSFSVHIIMTECFFSRNFYGGVYISMMRSFKFNMTIQNCEFSEQVGHDNIHSALHIECPGPFSIVHIVDTKLFNNAETSIKIVDCALEFIGYNVIENNTADVGAAIQVAGTGYVFTALNTTLVLRNNTAKFGGALYSKTKEKISTYSPCTFMSLENNATVNFSNNTALIAGDNMYGGLAKSCLKITEMLIMETKTTLDPPYFKCPQARHGMFQTASSVSSDPYSVLLCDESQKMSRKVTVKKYPGQSIDLMVTTAGYCNAFSPGFLNISAQSKELQILQDVQGQEINSLCKTISFRVLLLHNITSVSVLLDIAHSTLGVTQPSTVNINFLPCPHGMYLGDTKECQCTDAIANYVDQCNVYWIPNPLKKKVSQNNWLDYAEQSKCITIASICPYDYCSTDDVNFNLDDNTDFQCSNNRTGILCGQCKPGLSLVLGSNACKHCSNTYLLLLIVFFVAGLFLVAFIASLNMTISNGMLNGLLFYVNIVKLNETRLFPNGSIPVISQFISWLNLDFGIEVCLFNGLDAYWKTWLQFAFPLYVWLVTIGIILYSRYSVTFSQYLPTNIISVLATLILISFTKLLRNLTSVFMVTRIHCDDQSQLVWSTDGNIDYWSTKHSILMGFAALFLVFVACYTFLLVFSQCLLRVSNYKVCFCLQRVWFRISPFIDAYTGPFVPKYYYWPGILVFIRIIVTISFAYTSGEVEYINNYIIVIIEICIFNIFNSDIYQSKANYICERFFHINLCVLCTINSIYHMNDTFITMATITSVSLSLIVFIAIVCLHFYKMVRKMFLMTQHKKEIQPLLRPEGQDSHQSDNYSPSKTVRRRDSIIFEF